MSSMCDLAQFMLCHGTFDSDKNIHADYARVDAVIGDDMHVQLPEFFLDRVHFRFAPP